MGQPLATVRPGRAAAVGLLAGLLLGLLPLAPAGAQSARAIDDACPEGQVPDSGFTDTSGNTHEASIECIVAWEVARGTSETTYSPGLQVPRDQMASFIAQKIAAAGRQLPSSPPDAFSDDDGNVHEPNINALAALGVVRGDEEGNYNPEELVTRAQMATFINQAHEVVAGARHTSDQDFFTDDDGSVHEPNINGLASVGVVAGVGGGKYEPAGAVSRGAMASFVARELDVLVEAGIAFPPFLEFRLPSLLGVPELVEVERVTGSSTQLRYVFDEPVATTDVVSARFRVYDFGGNAVTADSTTRSADGISVTATFSFQGTAVKGLDSATTATVAFQAVRDVEDTTKANPEAGFPLQEAVLAAGETEAPDLTAVENITVTSDTQATAEFVFDEAAHNLKSGGYNLVLRDGSTLTSTSVEAVSGSMPDTTYRATFTTVTRLDPAQVRRGHVAPETVADGTDQNARTNPQQAVAVAEDGATERPDLVGIDLLEGQDQVVYRFDVPIEVVPGGTYRLYMQDARTETGTSPTRTGQQAVTVQFLPGTVTPLVAGASVDANAVRAVGSVAEVNATDEEGVARTVAAGRTAAPDLLSVVRTQEAGPGDTRNRRIIYSFDEPVGVVENPAGFFVYRADGVRAQIPTAGAESGCRRSLEEGSAHQVICTVNSQEHQAVFQFVGDAVLGSVLAEVVDDADTTRIHTNYEASKPL